MRRRPRSYPALRSTLRSFASSLDYGARRGQRSRYRTVFAHESVTPDEPPAFELLPALHLGTSRSSDSIFGLGQSVRIDVSEVTILVTDALQLETLAVHDL